VAAVADPRSYREAVANRYFRRLQQFGKSFSARRSRGALIDTHAEVFAANTPQDVTSVRAKSAGHRKRTADKWNQ
jgi:hypothetical protein